MLAYFMANLCVAYINWPFDCTRTESDSKVKYYKINEGDKKLPHTRAEVPILRGKYITKISLVQRRAHTYILAASWSKFRVLYLETLKIKDAYEKLNESAEKDNFVACKWQQIHENAWVRTIVTYL